jgi:threonine-phosphate decarboxylase
MITTWNIPLHGGQLRQISERFSIPVDELIDFSANINPDGPDPSVLATLKASLEDLSVLTSYPDLEEVALKSVIAVYSAVSPENIVVANGFIPLLECALHTLKIKRCVLPVPAFVEYRRSLERCGVEIKQHLLTPSSNFEYDVRALLDGGHDAILLANPQNPSGILASKETVIDLVRRSSDRNITVFLDEAFIDYAPLHSLTPDVEQFKNLIVFRSVTKFHGIPGLRVAYAAANQALATSLNQSLPPWPITTLASRAVAAAMENHTSAARTLQLNNTRRTQLSAGLTVQGIQVYPSAGNYLLFKLPLRISLSRFWERMIREHRIVLRDCSNYDCLPPGHLRCAVRTERENEKLIAAIREIFSSQ